VADRYCGNCGQELRQDDRFCPSCGRPVHETAHVPTPQADDVATPPPPSSPQEHRESGAWRRVKLGLWWFIVVPVLLAIALFVFLLAWGFINGLAGTS
jgi:hypothetical protein